MLLSSKLLAVISFLKARECIHEQCPVMFSLCHTMEKQRGLGKFNYGNFFPSFWSLSQVEKYLKRSHKMIRNYMVEKLSHKTLRVLWIRCAAVLFPLPSLILISLELSHSSPWSSISLYLERKGDVSAFSFFSFFASGIPAWCSISFHFNWDLNERATAKLILQCL